MNYFYGFLNGEVYGGYGYLLIVNRILFINIFIGNNIGNCKNLFKFIRII